MGLTDIDYCRCSPKKRINKGIGEVWANPLRSHGKKQKYTWHPLNFATTNAANGEHGRTYGLRSQHQSCWIDFATWMRRLEL
jgi:hypothetical protein